MATSVSRVYLNNCNYELAYDLLSQSVANNTSTVRLYGILHVTGNRISWSRGSASVHTSGLQGIGTYYSRGDYVVITRDFTFSHDGNGNFSAYIGASLSTTFVSGDTGGTITLPKINRYPILNSGQNFNDESNPVYNITSYNTFPIRIKLEAGGNSQLIKRDVPASTNGNYTLVLTNAERNTLRTLAKNSNQLSVIETVCAMSGNTELSASYKSYKMNIINANPVFNDFEFEDVNSRTLALTGNNKININGYSTIKATIPTISKAEPLKNSTMTKYRFSIGESTVDISYSSDQDVTGTIQNSSSGTYNIYAIDSRNNSTLVTKLATQEIKYEKPYIEKQITTIQRNNNQVGTSAILNLKGTFWNSNFGLQDNSINITYKLKKTTSNEWIDGTTTITPTINENDFTFNGAIASNNSNTQWDIDSSYDIKIIVTDKIATVEYDLILNSGIPTMSLDKNGVGIMCTYDNSKGGFLQVNGKTLEEYIREIVNGGN